MQINKRKSKNENEIISIQVVELNEKFFDR